MKTLLALIALAFAAVCFAAEAAPRTVTLPSGPHPSAQIVSVDAATGTLTFAYLRADGTRADSGNSIARFTPVEPIPPEQPGGTPTYPEISDATLAAAILATP